MGLTVVATFVNLQEAQIAAAALRSGGLHVDVMDDCFGSAAWTNQFALQGFRVTVPESEVADAVAYLSALPEPGPRRATKASPSSLMVAWTWRVMAVVACLFLAPVFGWLMVGGLRQRRWGRGAEVFASAIMAATAIIATLLAFRIVLSLLAAFSSRLAPPYG